MEWLSQHETAAMQRLTPEQLAEIWRHETGTECPADARRIAAMLSDWADVVGYLNEFGEHALEYSKGEAVEELSRYIEALELTQALIVPRAWAGMERPAEWLPVADWVEEKAPASDAEHAATYRLLARRLAAARALLAAVNAQPAPAGRKPSPARDWLVYDIVGDLQHLGATAEKARAMCAEVMRRYGLPVPSCEREIRRVEQRHAARVEAGQEADRMLCVISKAAQSVETVPDIPAQVAQEQAGMENNAEAVRWEPKPGWMGPNPWAEPEA